MIFGQYRILHREIAIFFLAFVIMDVSYPQRCTDDKLVFEIPSVLAESAKYFSNISEPASALHKNSPPSGMPDQSAPELEDCFCCCSHIVPGTQVSAASLAAKPSPTIPKAVFLPSPPRNSFFHPPRFV